MSRLTGNDTKCLMEAYASVYAPQELTEEQVWVEVENWVNSLLEEGYDLSDYTWEEMYESYLEEQVPSNKDMIRKGFERADTQAAFSRAAEKRTGIKTSTPAFSRPASARPQQGLSGSIRTVPGRVLAPRGASSAARPAAAAPGAAARPAGAAPAGAGASSAPASSTAAKPAAEAPAPAAQTGDKAKDTATWAAANPKLAAASAERERTRGTSATTNPLMRDFKDRLPAPKTPSPSTAARGFELASKGVDLSKPPSSTTPSASTTAADTSKAKAKVMPRTRSQVLNQSFDVFDYILEHLVAEGYADTNESALAIMANMSEEWRESIVEQSAYITVGDPPQRIRDYNNDNKTQSQIDREKRMSNFANKRLGV